MIIKYIVHLINRAYFPLIRERMQILHIFFISALFNLSNAEFGTIIKFEPASLSIKFGTNTTFRAKLMLTNTTDTATSKNVSVTLQSEEEIVLNPYELNFNFGSNTSESDVKQVHLFANRCGYREINTTNASQIDNINEAFLAVRVYKFVKIKWTIEIVGWIYFLAWSLSFYPQTYTNFKRNSVEGFNFDYVALNFVGHTSYCIFNVGLRYFEFQNQYFRKHEHGVNPVQLNDVLFSSHAVFATIVHIVQCFIYEKGDQKISKICMALLGLIFVVIVVGLTLAIFDVHDYLSFLYFFSYITLATTFLKYCPQAYQNWKSQITNGWSIGFVYLDIIGGFNIIIQMMLIAYNFDDWPSRYGDLGKLGVGAISILFDFLFFFQHYFLYKDNNDRVLCFDPLY